jgi:hypothetical protein
VVRRPGEQLVAGEAGGVVEGAGRDHELVGSGAVDELGEGVRYRGGIADHVTPGLFRHHRQLGG